MALKPKNKKKQHHNQQSPGKKQVQKPKSWLDLPRQLHNIAEGNPNLHKNINVGGIIKSWRTSPKQCNSHSKLPWLQLCNPDAANTEKYHRHVAWSGSIEISTAYMPFGRWLRPFIRKLARYPWKNYVGCSHGILVAEAASLYMYNLWNPRNRETFRLPLWDPKVPIKLVVLSSPPEDHNCTVMALTGIGHPAFAFYKLKRRSNGSWITPEPQWTMQDCTLTEPLGREQQVVQLTNAIGFQVTDLSSKRIIPSVSSNHFREYLLESEGEIFLVLLLSRKSSVHSLDGVEVYQLNMARLSWFKVESVGERAVFVGSNCSVSVVASEVGCRRNCVYFRHLVDDDEWNVYDMEIGSISQGWSEANPTISSAII
ncbi:unnamed protein product [Sphenostylis stenocarpa]|uniref:KIB1-4 beta-propeller domain-containing protein n=1 Tax=Sphenostylis stenocarpa TaxID=92480 RepID=A0AA86VB75_9FABA|nr:unnamed protein product [Sphenostylis stenocarpa]